MLELISSCVFFILSDKMVVYFFVSKYFFEVIKVVFDKSFKKGTFWGMVGLSCLKVIW